VTAELCKEGGCGLGTSKDRFQKLFHAEINAEGT
jgi:hypothetical protein